MASQVIERTSVGGVAPDAVEGGSPPIIDPHRLARLRWRCRRGMLENDLVLERFLLARGDSLTEADAARLDRLLELSDNELWDLVSRRTEPADASLAPLLEALRN